LYILAALKFLIIGGVAGALLRADLDVTTGDYGRLLSFHSTVASTLVIAPLWVGLATYFVPLQIGAVSLAYPRLQAAAFWTYAIGGTVHMVSYLGGDRGVLDLSSSHFSSYGGANIELWVTSLALVAIASILAAANLLATVLSMRTEGMTLARIPMFSWATLVTSVGTLIAAPAFLAGLLLAYLDQHFGGTSFFGPTTFGTQVLWQHLLWLYGRPEIYLLIVPGLGAASDLISTAARRPLANLDAARTAIAAVAVLGFAAWAAGTDVADAVILPTYSIATAAVALPIGMLLLVWLDTLRRGTPRFVAGAPFVLAALAALGVGAAAAVAAAAKSVDGGTTWSTGQVHVVAFAVPLLLAVGAVHYWSPKLYGRPIGTGLGALSALAIFGGAVLSALGSYIAGWDGAQRGINVSGGAELLTRVGGVLLLAGVVAVWASVARGTYRPGDPVDEAGPGLTLEWATTSPPPPHNFDTIPEVRSATPVADLVAVGSD
jgi:cytochrome c oxidase subunit 1